MNPRSEAPQGRPYTSPWQRPGLANKNELALKGRPIRRMKPCSPMRAIWSAPSGLDSFAVPDLGRCSRLVWQCPVGAQKGGAA